MQERLEQYLDKKYILKSGRNIYLDGVHYFNAQLTDKLAEAALKKYPNYAGKFIGERERKVLEAKVTANKQIKGAQALAGDERLEREIHTLIVAGNFDEARQAVEGLKVEETRELYLSDIDQAEKKSQDDKSADENRDLVVDLINEGKFDEARQAASKLKGKGKEAALKAIDQSEKEASSD